MKPPLLQILNGPATPSSPMNVNARCAACGRDTVFLAIAGQNDIAITAGPPPYHAVGHRVCANASCRMHAFVVVKGGTLVSIYPRADIPFIRDGIPESIVSAMDEALTCFVNECYRASAMLVRRTLELLCNHVGSTGKDLNERITGLSSRVVLPAALLQALHDVRLLGNDAAHIDAKSYDSVGKEEVSASIEITQLVLSNLFQTDSVVGKLRAFKKN